MSNARAVGSASAYAIYVSIVSAIALAFWQTVPQPYMDEIFHIRQAQTFTEDWQTYDPKLTTPPGLYIPSALLTRLTGTNFCTVTALRSVNAALLLALPILLTDLLRLIRSNAYPSTKTTEPVDQRLTEGLAISAFPVAFFFGFLYYTDLASLVTVLLAYRAALRNSYYLSAAWGAFSLTLRQTNILWIAYIAFEALDRNVTSLSMGAGPERLFYARRTEGNLIGVLSTFFGTTLTNPRLAFKVLSPYIPLAIAFIAFVRWNEGIVLGDKSMHVAVLHVPQLYYFTAFATVMLSPHFLSMKMVTSICRQWYSTKGGGVCWSVYRFTIEHPFLLADNRHYPFYIWRRILNAHPLARYAVSPIYLVCGTALVQNMWQSKTWSLLSFGAWASVTCLVLVPSPLLEFRYFIIPFVIYRLHLPRPQTVVLSVEALLYALINSVTVYVFLRRPFTWPTEDGWQRFMW